MHGIDEAVMLMQSTNPVGTIVTHISFNSPPNPIYKKLADDMNRQVKQQYLETHN